MSQHYFHTAQAGTPVTVLMGWDRPLNRFFLVVERRSPATGEDDYVYVSDMDPDSVPLLPTDFAKKLDELGIALPQSVVQQVCLDQLLGSSNRIVTHQSDGSFLSQQLSG